MQQAVKVERLWLHHNPNLLRPRPKGLRKPADPPVKNLRSGVSKEGRKMVVSRNKRQVLPPIGHVAATY